MDFPNHREEIAMKATLTLARPYVAATMAAAALSILIAIGLLTAVTGLFQRDGASLEQVVIAEHACASNVFVSERETCVRSHLATSRAQDVARR
jgi:hypothetical protein